MKITDCTSCKLHRGRTNIVNGEGPNPCRIAFIGEAPGFSEDLSGRPFVGRSGELLRACMIQAGFDLSEVYITNIVKCRPPNNRDPLNLEIITCSAKHLFIELYTEIKPKIIVAVGRVAANYFRPGTRITEEHGKVFDHNTGREPIKYKFIPIYHPAYILRNNSKTQEFVDDFKKIYEQYKA